MCSSSRDWRCTARAGRKLPSSSRPVRSSRFAHTRRSTSKNSPRQRRMAAMATCSWRAAALRRWVLLREELGESLADRETQWHASVACSLCSRVPRWALFQCVQMKGGRRRGVFYGGLYVGLEGGAALSTALKVRHTCRNFPELPLGCALPCLCLLLTYPCRVKLAISRDEFCLVWGRNRVNALRCPEDTDR